MISHIDTTGYGTAETVDLDPNAPSPGSSGDTNSEQNTPDSMSQQNVVGFPEDPMPSLDDFERGIDGKYHCPGDGCAKAYSSRHHLKYDNAWNIGRDTTNSIDLQKAPEDTPKACSLPSGGLYLAYSRAARYETTCNSRSPLFSKGTRDWNWGILLQAV